MNDAAGCLCNVCFPVVSAMVGTGASATRTKDQLSNMAEEYHPKKQ